MGLKYKDSSGNWKAIPFPSEIDDTEANAAFTYSSEKIEEKFQPKEDGKGLSENDFTTAQKEKLEGLSNYDDTEIKTEIAKKRDNFNIDTSRGLEIYQSSLPNSEPFLGLNKDTMQVKLTSDDESIKILNTVSTSTPFVFEKDLSINDEMYAKKSALPTKTSELTNDSNFVVDENYQHTDNNYTTDEKVKLASLNNYDDTELTNAIQQKQDQLTAGENITILNDVISAQCAIKILALSTDQSNPTILTDVGAGAFIVTQTGYLKTTGGFTKLIGVGAELIIVNTNMNGVVQLCCTVQTGSSVLLFWDTMTAQETNEVFVSTLSIKSDISASLTNRQVLGALYTKELLEQKQDKITVGDGLKLDNGTLSLDIETATAQTAYGGE